MQRFITHVHIFTFSVIAKAFEQYLTTCFNVKETERGRRGRMAIGRPNEGDKDGIAEKEKRR
jgi:hypothetical protein